MGHVVHSFISALLTWKSSSDLHQHGQIARPVACCQYIPHPPTHTPPLSLLFFADVQTFCSEKESLFVTPESFKEKDTTRLSLFYNSARQNIRSLSPRSVCPPWCRPAPARVPWKLQISFVVVIVEANTNIDLERHESEHRKVFEFVNLINVRQAFEQCILSQYAVYICSCMLKLYTYVRLYIFFLKKDMEHVTCH